MQNEEIKLNEREQRNLIELGMYAFAETIREEMETKLFKQEQGI